MPHVERQGGVLTLPDVYCLFNRARGSELVSPADVLKARPLLLHRGVITTLTRVSAGMPVVAGQPAGGAAPAPLRQWCHGGPIQDAR